MNMETEGSCPQLIIVMKMTALFAQRKSHGPEVMLFGEGHGVVQEDIPSVNIVGLR